VKRLKRETESSRSAVPVAVDAEEEAEAVKSSGTTRPLSSGRRLKILVPAAALIVAAAIGGVLYFRSRPATPLTEKDIVVLADFDNTTGNANYDDAIEGEAWLRAIPGDELIDGIW
jgi:eukaryotic-like serine/threonine-protein kinase